jgi:hypothetical protein
MTAECERVLQHLCGNPLGSETMTTKAYRELQLATGAQVMSCGSLYRIKGRSLGAGVYEVSLVRWKP